MSGTKKKITIKIYCHYSAPKYWVDLYSCGKYYGTIILAIDKAVALSLSTGIPITITFIDAPEASLNLNQ